MPTGLDVNKKLASFGNISMQAVEPADNIFKAGNLNVSNAYVVGANKIVGDGLKTISENQVIGTFGSNKIAYNTLPSLQKFASVGTFAFTSPGFVNIDKNVLQISHFFKGFFNPLKLKGMSEQRPEIISLADFNPYYEREAGSDLSDAGEFIKTSISARKLRFEHIQALIKSIQEVDDANKIFKQLAQEYSSEISQAKETVKFMTKIVRSIKRLKNSFNVRRTEESYDEPDEENVSAFSYKDFLINEYGFSKTGYANFSNTKILGQFFFDCRNTLRQYSPTLFGEGSPAAPNNYTSPVAQVNGFAANQPAVNDGFSILGNFATDEAQESVEVQRAADNKFGTYNISTINITDGQFNFQVRLFSDVDFPILGTPFNQFLDILPGGSLDRISLLLMALSKELRVSRGLGREDVQNVLIDTFNGDSTGDPFTSILGSPGEEIADVPIGEKSFCSLLHHVNEQNQTVLPFESLYVRGENNLLYIPGSVEFADSVLQFEDPTLVRGTAEPYDVRKLQEYQERFSDISDKGVSTLRKIFNIGKRRPRLRPINLYNNIGRDFTEGITSLLAGLTSQSVQVVQNKVKPPKWAEVAFLKLAFENREIKQLLFQYVLTLGLIGKPSREQFGNNSIEPIFRLMSRTELSTWGDLPIVQESLSLGSATQGFLNGVLSNLGLDEGLAETIKIADLPTRNNTIGYTVLAFIADRLIKNTINATPNISSSANASVYVDLFKRHLISTKDLVFLNRIADFITSITNRAGDNYLEDDKTRFNRLRPTALAAFAFEAFMSYIEPLLTGISVPYVPKDFFVNTPKAALSIAFDSKALNNARSQTALLLGNYSAFRTYKGLAQLDTQSQLSVFAAQQQLALASPAGSAKNKLIREEQLIRQIIERIRRTFRSINRSASNVVNLFNKQGINGVLLNQLIEAQGGRERVAMINEMQLVLARRALADFSTGEGTAIDERMSLPLIQSSPSYNNTQANISGLSYSSYNAVSFVHNFAFAKDPVPVFVDGTVVPENENKLMEIILKRSKFRGSKAENLKILTVGLPSGFSDCLNAEINIAEDNADDILDKSRDVISVNVYRRSIDFEDIVFKPIPYIFELTRFVSRPEISKGVIEPQRFNEFLNDESIKFMRDYSERARGEKQTLQAFIENDDYSFLTEEQKRQMVINHIESYILGTYMQLLNGVSTDESDYLVNDDLAQGYVSDDAKEKFQDLVLTYVQGVTGEPISLQQLKDSSPQIQKLLEKIDDFRLNTNFTEQIVPPNIPDSTVSLETRIELTEDLLNFVKLYTPKSLLTGGDIQALRITSPKTFERIFNLAVDPDDFEIDIDKTFATTSGKLMYSAIEKAGLLESPTKIKRNIGELSKIATNLENRSFVEKTGFGSSFKRGGSLLGDRSKSTKIRERSKDRTISLDQFFVTISSVEASA